MGYLVRGCTHFCGEKLPDHFSRSDSHDFWRRPLKLSIDVNLKRSGRSERWNVWGIWSKLEVQNFLRGGSPEKDKRPARLAAEENELIYV